ncbi:MAG: hypothetical protein ACTSRS_12745 [Candidatus Helarchaeota archaeon]
MEFNDFLSRLAEYIEETIGAQLTKGEYRIGKVDLTPISELVPLNKPFEGLLIRCSNCQKATIFFSLGTIDHYLDEEKRSLVNCRHCHFAMPLPLVRQIRQKQGQEYNFLMAQDWKLTKILLKRGKILEVSPANFAFIFQFENETGTDAVEIKVPPQKFKNFQSIVPHLTYRLKIKVFQALLIEPRSFLQKTASLSQPQTIPIFKYELISLFKVK